jgi:hypothetical protein
VLGSGFLVLGAGFWVLGTDGGNNEWRRLRTLGLKSSLKYWFEAGLFADFVGGNPIDVLVPLNRYCFYIICIYRMV